MGNVEVILARHRVLEAALRVIRSEIAPGGEYADSAAEAEYADEQLALAARDLTRAIDKGYLKPVAW